jgi:hypothetical protein
VERKAKLRADVQLDKVHAMVSRIQAHALRREEARLAYEETTKSLHQRSEELEVGTYGAMAESSALIDRIRALKSLKAQAETSHGAQRSINASVYVDA